MLKTAVVDNNPKTTLQPWNYALAACDFYDNMWKFNDNMWKFKYVPIIFQHRTLWKFHLQSLICKMAWWP